MGRYVRPALRVTKKGASGVMSRRKRTNAVSGAQVRASANLVSLAHPPGEDVVKMFRVRHPELMQKQARGVRRRSPDTRITHLALQVEVPIKPPLSRHRARKPAPGSLQGNGRLAHAQRERAAAIRQGDKTAVEPHDPFRPAGQMAFDTPRLSVRPRHLCVHPRQFTRAACLAALPRKRPTLSCRWPGARPCLSRSAAFRVPGRNSLCRSGRRWP